MTQILQMLQILHPLFCSETRSQSNFATLPTLCTLTSYTFLHFPTLADVPETRSGSDFPTLSYSSYTSPTFPMLPTLPTVLEFLRFYSPYIPISLRFPKFSRFPTVLTLPRLFSFDLISHDIFPEFPTSDKSHHRHTLQVPIFHLCVGNSYTSISKILHILRNCGPANPTPPPYASAFPVNPAHPCDLMHLRIL